jgi:Flp pilus assembly protein TadG
LSRRWHIARGRRSDRRPDGYHDERGQSLLEAAFIVPILLLLLVVVVDAARAFDAYIVLTNAVREGARYGSIVMDPERQVVDIETLVINNVLGSGTNITYMQNFTASNVIATKGTRVVTVTATYEFPLWFGGLVGLDTFHLEKTSAMPIFASE